MFLGFFQVPHGLDIIPEPTSTGYYATKKNRNEMSNGPNKFTEAAILTLVEIIK